MPTEDRDRTTNTPQGRLGGTSRPLSSEPALARLAREDAVGQLRRREGTMLRLGSENGVPMLDWVEAVPRLLADPTSLVTVEAEARQLAARGIRHVIWAGMGGSVLTVRVLCALGFCAEGMQVHPLDSTDPRALNRVICQLAEAKGVTLPVGPAQAGQHAEVQGQPAEAADDGAYCHDLFADVLMVGVAMGKTSEEPISHLDWFTGLLRRGGLALAKHALVMAIPDSYLERYAEANGIPRLPLQLDGGAGTPGRMSAPSTRVFLLPAAIALAASGSRPGGLRAVLEKAWAAYDLDGAAEHPQQHPFVRLAAALASTASSSACALWLALPTELEALRWWTEQLMEESLGKGGKGIVVFSDQRLARSPRAARMGSPRLTGLQVRIVPQRASSGGAPPATADTIDRSNDSSAAGDFTLYQPLLAADGVVDRLAGSAALFLGMQLSMTLYAYLNDIPFAGQPAVEQYKTRARELRTTGDPIQHALAATSPLSEGPIRILPPPTAAATSLATSPEAMLAATLAAPPTYLDLTINGEVSEADTEALDVQLRRLGNDVLGVPVKLRRAPASYHSTEQSEMDGPAGLVSVRALAERSEPVLLGSYDPTFLHAQAVGTWMAMNEQGRTCYLFLYDGNNVDMARALSRFLDGVARRLAPGGWEGSP